MNQPWVYMCPPSWIRPPPPSPSHPSGLSQCTGFECLFHASDLDWWSSSYMVIYMFQCYSLKSSHPRILPHNPFCSLYLCLFCCLVYRVIITIFLNSIYDNLLLKKINLPRQNHRLLLNANMHCFLWPLDVAAVTERIWALREGPEALQLVITVQFTASWSQLKIHLKFGG